MSSMDINYYLDLEAFHAWATGKLLGYCRTLSDDALDSPRNLGLGTLRATMKHIAAAEQLWLDRWQGKATGPLPETPDSIDALGDLFVSLANQRKEWLARDPRAFSNQIQYKNIQGQPFEHELGELVQHVLNHGVHHRAQAAHFLKHQGIKIPGGIDYIFYRIAKPTLLLPPESAESSRQWGLEVGTVALPYSPPSIHSLMQYSRYGDWAMGQLFEQTQSMTDEQLDHEWGIGVGGIRKSLLHLYEAECFWQANWRKNESPFPKTEGKVAISELREQWHSMANTRLAILQNTTREQLGRCVTVNFGGGPLGFRFSESVIQLAVHGTLHRAQITNMIRSTGATPKALDYVVWIRE
jgi:uncharacterized damage-inducible protein DinB